MGGVWAEVVDYARESLAMSHILGGCNVLLISGNSMGIEEHGGQFDKSNSQLNWVYSVVRRRRTRNEAPEGGLCGPIACALALSLKLWWMS